MSSTKFGVALLGFGTVGTGVYNLLEQQTKQIQEKYGFGFEVRKILVRDPDKRGRFTSIPKKLLAKNIDEILSDQSIDVVVEVMGGENPAKGYIIDALKAGKHVITANKRLCGSHGESLVSKARQYGKFFGFAAAVTGFHQFCPSIVNSVTIKSVVGIFNGTSNYILTRMEEGLSGNDALHEAQVKGYAEADPSEDIDGLDTRNKLIVVSRLAFGKFLSVKDIDASGIRNISKIDMEFASELGYTIKLLGISRRENNTVHAVVCPCLVPKKDSLASVKGVNNGIKVYDELRGVQGMAVAGAGSNPTSMAIFSDLISMAKGDQILWPAPSAVNQNLKYSKSEWPSKYYLRIQVANQPGVLAKVSKAFGKSGINIADVLQKADKGDVKLRDVPIVLVCGPTIERNVQQALRSIKAITLASPVLIRVEDPSAHLKECAFEAASANA
jgi:homoserine dehydrogenase